MVFGIELVFLAEGHMAYGIVFLDELLHLLLYVVAGLGGYLPELGYDAALLLKVVALFVALVGSLGVACLEELVAGGEELFP